MRLIRSLGRRLQSLVSKESSNSALHEELRIHLAKLVEENMAQGMPEREAVAAAQASFGSWAGTTEQCYQARGTAWIDDFLQDLRYGLRTLKKHRFFSATSVSTLALGIGACTAIFSVVNAVLLRPLPYESPEQLVNLYTPSLQLLRQGIPAELFNPSFADFFDLKKESHLLEAVTLFEQTSFNVAADDQVERVGAARVDAEFFRTLQSQPEVGRAIDAGDLQPGSNRVTIISHGLWLEMFSGSKNILERTIRFDGTTYVVRGWLSGLGLCVWVFGCVLGVRRDNHQTSESAERARARSVPQPPLELCLVWWLFRLSPQSPAAPVQDQVFVKALSPFPR